MSLREIWVHGRVEPGVLGLEASCGRMRQSHPQTTASFRRQRIHIRLHALLVLIRPMSPGFAWALLRGCGGGGVFFSSVDFRAPPLSLSVTREEAGLEGESELFMQLWGTEWNM